MTSEARTTEDDGKVTKVKPAADTVEPAATRDDGSEVGPEFDEREPLMPRRRDDEPDPNAVTTRLDNVESALRLHGLMP